MLKKLLGLSKGQARTGDRRVEVQAQRLNSDPEHPSGHKTSMELLPEGSQYPSFPEGVEVLVDCPDATIDICFVHGLSGNRVETWSVKGSKPWPETLLPRELKEARVLTYGYDAYVTRNGETASMNLLADHAESLVTDLTNFRGSLTRSRPLIFVAHSLGGLVCKEAILLSQSNHVERLKGIFLNTHAIAFLGTPHKGSSMANWANIPVSALGVFKSTNKYLIDVLKPKDQYIESLNSRFHQMLEGQKLAGRPMGITCFFEELPAVHNLPVVPKDSAIMDNYQKCSIHANHNNMVKFDSARDNGFKKLLGQLKTWQEEINTVTTNQSRVSGEAGLQGLTDTSSVKYGAHTQTIINGNQNNSQGSGHQFNGASFAGPVQVGGAKDR